MPIKKPLPRRTFLKGAGVALALPFMEAMIPINRSWAAQPSRFAVLYTGVGMRSDGSSTRKFIHPEIRQVLSPFDSQATYITGLINDGITNNHDEISGFMAGCTPGAYKYNTSIDRAFAALLGSPVLFKDGLYVGTEARASQQSVLFKSLSQKLGSQSNLYNDPKALFDLITTLGGFKTTTTPGTVSDPLKRDVLSLALESIKSLKRELSSRDNAVLDQHLTAIEQVQNSLNGTSGVSGCVAPSVSSSYPNNRGDLRMPVIADLAAIALNCDLTRSLSFLIFPDASGSTSAHQHFYDSFEALYGVRPGVGYHEWSHKRWKDASNTSNTNTTRCQASMLTADKWDATIAARFLGKLNPDVLDSAAIAYASGGGYDGAHPTTASGVSGEDGSHYNIPFVLYGKLNGQLKPRGTSTPLHVEQSIANVWLTLLRKAGSQATSFGTLRDPLKTVAGL